VLTTAEFYGLKRERAESVVGEIVSAVSDWRDVARETGISAADIDITAAAFSASAPRRSAVVSGRATTRRKR